MDLVNLSLLVGSRENSKDDGLWGRRDTSARPKFRGFGIGTELSNYVFAWARERGATIDLGSLTPDGKSHLKDSILKHDGEEYVKFPLDEYAGYHEKKSPGPEAAVRVPR